ncbi:Insulinase (Peptidase M16), partial [Dissophora globulifera]
MTEQGQERRSSGNHSSDKDGDATASEYQQDQDDQEDVDALTGQSWSSDADNDTDRDEEEDEVESEQEPAEKSTKGYRKKVKKPSGKKGKIFADTRAMLSIIAQVAGKEEERAQIKQTQMGKIKSKSSIKEQKQAEKEQARKKLIEQKIDEIKRRKTEKRKDAKNRAEKEAEAAASAAPRKTIARFQSTTMQSSTQQVLPDGYVQNEEGTHAEFLKPIEKSLNDDRLYRLIRLHNDLEVLLIQDPSVDKSAAALDVHVGHLSDPNNLQGLAHFLEHLLFMGTAKYPRENEYSEFLAQHSGSSNAFTGLDNTNYYFEVGHAHLEGALDRFAQFFIAPAFSENCKDRELRAVDSEHKKNLQSDSWRLFQLEKSLSSPDHPYSQFGTGNLETLQDAPGRDGIDVRDELIKFHSKYYSANIMKLIILGREPLDQLAKWAIEMFSDIKNLGIKPPANTNPPWTAKELLKTSYVKPVKDVRSLEIKFPFPDQYPFYTVHPARYLTHAIGHEGSGSILSLLKKKGWANNLSAGTSHGGIGFEFFKITVDLTKEGLQHYEDVTVIIFQYIQMLRQEGIRPYIWDEIASLAATSFRFKEKSPAAGYVSRLAGVMQRGYAPEWVLSGSYLIRESDPAAIMQCIDALKTDGWKSHLVTQDTSVVPGGAFTDIEKWYGTEYHVENVSLALLQKLQHLESNPELYLPAPNDFIPENFETGKNPTDTPLKTPVLLKHTPIARIWHKKDDVFWVPKVNIYFQLKSPLAYSSPSSNVKTHLYVNLLKDALNEYSYDADLAGLSYSLDTTVEGMILSVEGYNDKAHVLLQKVVEKMKTLKIDPDRFKLIQDQMDRMYSNFRLEAPHQHAMYYMSYLTQEKLWTQEEKLAELRDLTSEDIQAFYPMLLSRLHIEGLIHGNITTSEALRAGLIVEEVLSPKALVPSELLSQRSHLLPEQCKAVYRREVPDPNNVNSGVEYYLQIEDATSKESRARIQLMAQIINEPCFNQLRTKEQLGYLVFSGVRKQTGAIGLRFILQSERDPVYLESRIEHFLESRMKTYLQELTEEEYEKQAHSLIQKKLEKDKNLRQETYRYWGQIASGYYDFDEIQDEVDEIRKTTLGALRDFFNVWMLPSASKTKKLSVHLHSQKARSVASGNQESEGDGGDKASEEHEESAGLREGTLIVEDIVGFKAGLELIPVRSHSAPAEMINATLIARASRSPIATRVYQIGSNRLGLWGPAKSDFSCSRRVPRLQPSVYAVVCPYSSSSRQSSIRNYPLSAIGLICGGVALTAFGLFKFYTSGVNRFPEPIRNDLRKALYYQNYGDDPEKAVTFYRSALNAALQHPELKVDGAEVTGIMIQLGGLFQDLGRVREAIEVLGIAFEYLVHGETTSTTINSQHGSEGQAAPHSEPHLRESARHRLASMDGPTRLKTVGIAQKLGDLYHLIGMDEQTERYYLWSVEQLMRNHEEIETRRLSGQGHGGTNATEEERLQFARDRESMRVQFSFDNLPVWMTKTDFGASLEALGGFYSGKGVYSKALPLYMRALSMVDPNSCHAAVLMCNISDVFAGLGQTDEAVGWAERGFKVGAGNSGQECDEGCGVLLFNLGVLHE